jgi:hypothetical protein
MVPPPVMVTPAEIATGGMRAAALEGVLVRVENVDVTNPNPAPEGGEAAPTNEYQVTGNLRVDDGLYLTAPYPVMGERFASITGVLIFARSNSKLNPRSADDLVAGAASLLPFPTETVFARVGGGARPTFPAALSVRLARAVMTPTTVTVRSSDPGLTVADVVIPAGVASAVVPVTGVTAAAMPYTLTATLGTVSRTASVRVLGATEAPRLATLTPAMATTGLGAPTTFTVTLEIPAPTGGAAVAVSVMGGATAPAMVTVPADALSATFDVTAGAMAGAVTVTASLGGVSRMAALTVVEGNAGGLIINEVDYDQPGTDNAEFVELYNAGRSPVDLSTVALVFVNGSNNQQYSRINLSGTLAPGAYAVVASSGVMVPTGVARFPIGNEALQNGAPDGVALIDTAAGTLLDALSYEGAIRAAQITGIPGTVNLVEGTVLPAAVADSNAAPGSLSRAPNGVDTDDAANDWRFVSMPTPGAANAAPTP